MNVLDDIFHIEVQKLSDIKLIGNKTCHSHYCYWDQNQY